MKRRLECVAAAWAAAALACGAPKEPPAAHLEGPALYARGNCKTCHGADRQGTGLAPSLERVDEHWTAETLASYLADPYRVTRGDPRLQEVAERFGQTVMPPFGAPDADRRSLAEWLIESAK